MKEILFKLFNKYKLPEAMQSFLYGYSFWFVLTFALFILAVGFDYILENTSTSNDTIGVILFVIKYLITLASYLIFILITFFTLATFIILIPLIFLTKVFYKSDLALLEITLVRLNEVLTLKRYWVVYIIIALIIIILADNNMLGLNDLF